MVDMRNENELSLICPIHQCALLPQIGEIPCKFEEAELNLITYSIRSFRNSKIMTKLNIYSIRKLMTMGRGSVLNKYA